MTSEIERKFILASLPRAIDPASKVIYERHFLKIGPDEELRIQRKGNKFYCERKVTSDKLSSTKETLPITAQKFDELRQKAIGSIERDSYEIPDIQHGTIKVYHGRFEDLIRAEVEFPNSAAAAHFSPPSWFGAEITDSDLGRDSRLVKLSDAEFKALLEGAKRAFS